MQSLLKTAHVLELQTFGKFRETNAVQWRSVATSSNLFFLSEYPAVTIVKWLLPVFLCQVP
jgi:hypothetical protein